jgi:hypothetical protein
MVRTAHSPIVAQLTSDHLPSTSQQGMQLMPNPGGIRVLKATFEHDGDLVPVVDIIRPLMQRHIIGNAPVLRPGLTDAITHRTKADFENDQRGVVKREEETKFYKEFTSGTFSCSSASPVGRRLTTALQGHGISTWPFMDPTR